MPKKIFYCVDFHCPAGGMLGYSGGRDGRLGGRRRPGGYLRESDNGTPVSDILAAYEKLPEDLKKDMEQIAAGSDGAVIVKHKGGEFTVVEDGKPVMKRVSADEVRKSGKLGKKQVTVVTKDEIGKMLSECDDADPEKMMKEFVEKKRKCGVKEDEYRRPKNQPHNLHQVDEGEDVEEDEYRRPKNQPHNLHRVDESDAWVVDIDADGKDDVQFIVYASSEEDARKEAENEIKSHKLKNAKVKNIRPKDEKSKDDNDIEDAEDVFDEDESQFELNESLVRFCDRLIRG